MHSPAMVRLHTYTLQSGSYIRLGVSPVPPQGGRLAGERSSAASLNVPQLQSDVPSDGASDGRLRWTPNAIRALCTVDARPKGSI